MRLFRPKISEFNVTFDNGMMSSVTGSGGGGAAFVIDGEPHKNLTLKSGVVYQFILNGMSNQLYTLHASYIWCRWNAINASLSCYNITYPYATYTHIYIYIYNIQHMVLTQIKLIDIPQNEAFCFSTSASDCSSEHLLIGHRPESGFEAILLDIPSSVTERQNMNMPNVFYYHSIGTANVGGKITIVD